MSRTRSMPLSSDISTRLTLGTGMSAPVRVPREGVGGGEIGRRSGRRCQPLERAGDALDRVPRAAAIGGRGALRRCLGSGLFAAFGHGVRRLRRTLSGGPAALQDCCPKGRILLPKAGFQRQSDIAIGPPAAIVRADFVDRIVAAQAKMAHGASDKGDAKMFVTPAFAQAPPFVRRQRCYGRSCCPSS